MSDLSRNIARVNGLMQSELGFLRKEAAKLEADNATLLRERDEARTVALREQQARVAEPQAAGALREQSAPPADPAPGESAAERVRDWLKPYIGLAQTADLLHLADRAVADQQRLRERAEEAEARCQELRDRELEAKDRIAELQGTVRWQGDLIRRREADLAKANAALADRAQDTELLDAVAKVLTERPAKITLENHPVCGMAVLDSIRFPCGKVVDVTALDTAEPRALLRALADQGAQEPPEHPDTRRMRALEAFLEPWGNNIQRYQDNLLRAHEHGDPVQRASGGTLSKLADTLPDPDAPQEPEPGQDEA